MQVVPAYPDRPWMKASQTTFANRCLPMRIANQHGWFILNPTDVVVTWNGGIQQSDISITVPDGIESPALSHFGHGILTWWLPFLFRTPAGYNMHVRGPVNFCKDGITPLDAIVETDWAVASFPMSWRITRVGAPIHFAKGEPICMISPVPRSLAESFTPEFRDLSSDTELSRNFEGWSKSRKFHNQLLRAPKAPRLWQKHYFLGKHPLSDTAYPEHQVKLNIKSFGTKERSSPDQDTTLSSSVTSVCPYMNKRGSDSQSSSSKEGAPIRSVTDFFHLFEASKEALHKILFAPEQSRQIWSLDNQGCTKHLFSAGLEDVLRPDLAMALKERLQMFSDSHSLGKLVSLQATLLTGFTGRNRTTIDSNQTYLILPLLIQNGQCTLSLDMRHKSGLGDITRFISHKNRFTTKLNNLFSIAGQNDFSFTFSTSKAKSNGVALLIEGLCTAAS